MNDANNTQMTVHLEIEFDEAISLEECGLLDKHFDELLAQVILHADHEE